MIPMQQMQLRPNPQSENNHYLYLSSFCLYSLISTIEKHHLSGLPIYTLAYPQKPNHPKKSLDVNFRRLYAMSFRRDRKSTRLNSSHVKISYAVFCLKKTITE